MNMLKYTLVVILIATGSFLIPALSQAEQVTIVIASGTVGLEVALVNEAAQIYMESHPNVIVKALETAEITTDRLGFYLQLFQAQSQEVDVYQIDVIWPGDMAEHLVDLNQYGGAEAAKAHFPATVHNNTVDGKLLAIPWFIDAGMLYYRTDLLEKYGFSAPPKTWDELEEMALIIQQGEREAGNQDFWGFVWQGSEYEGLTCDAMEWIASHDGGSIVEPDGTISINNKNAVKALERARSWIEKISPPDVIGFAEEDSRRIWQAGNAAFMRNWPYAYKLSRAEDSPIRDSFDVAPLPGATPEQSAATLGGWQLAVSKYSKHPEIAADVALTLAGTAEQKRRAIKGNYNPTIMSLYDDPEVLEAAPFFKSLYDVFTNAVARPSTATAPRYNEVSTLIFTTIHQALTREKDPRTVVEELELYLEDVMAAD